MSRDKILPGMQVKIADPRESASELIWFTVESTNDSKCYLRSPSGERTWAYLNEVIVQAASVVKYAEQFNRRN